MDLLAFKNCPGLKEGYRPTDQAVLWLAFPETLTDGSRDLLGEMLDERETDRWRAFRKNQDRDQYLVARFLLRRVLSEYLCLTPRAVKLALGPYGKPCLSPDSEHNLEFNLSHTRDCVALLVAPGSPCGVDVETLEDDLPVEQLCSPNFFHASEKAEILWGGEVDEQAIRFLAHWTLKEAYLKARGEGLEGLSSQVRVISDRGAVQGIKDYRKAGCATENWRCGQIWLNNLYCLSVVIRNGPGEIDVVKLDLPS